jgi:hypothetical protein
MTENELAAVRSIRRAISEECGGEPDRVFDYYEEVQKRVKESGRYEFVKKPIRSVTSLGKQRHAAKR